MKILTCNKYFYRKGGAELVFFDTAALLKSYGHAVAFFSMQHPKNSACKHDEYFVANRDYLDERTSISKQITSAFNLLYSFEARNKISKVLDGFNPNVVHLHNIYHQLSPSILHAIKKRNIPVIMTLHDYKVACANYLMLSNGQICERCKDGKYINCFKQGCVLELGLV